MRIATNVSDQAITAHANFPPGRQARTKKNLGAAIAPRPPDPAQARAGDLGIGKGHLSPTLAPLSFSLHDLRARLQNDDLADLCQTTSTSIPTFSLASPARYSETVRHDEPAGELGFTAA